MIKIVAQMDDIFSINIKTDTTFLMLQEAQSRGHEIFYYTPQSIFFEDLIVPVLKKLNAVAISEVRANLILKEDNSYQSEFHVDRPYECKTAILYINTCNGYTLLHKDKKIKINSEENKILIFNSQISHAGVSQTDVDRRIVINFNYF